MKFDLITQDNASPEVGPILQQVREAYGFVPNTYGVMAHAPVAIAAYQKLNELLQQHSLFTPQEQQVVMLSISAENACEYCVAAHTAVAGMVKTPDDIIRAIREDGTIA